MIKIVNALLTVVGGVGGAARRSTGSSTSCRAAARASWRTGSSRTSTSCPAFAAIALYLIYPAIQTVINSFPRTASTQCVGLDNYTDLLDSHGLPADPVQHAAVDHHRAAVDGRARAAGRGARRPARPGGEKLAKTLIFLPMAISVVGAATIWRFVYAADPPGQTRSACRTRIVTGFGGDPVAWLQTPRSTSTACC